MGIENTLSAQELNPTTVAEFDELERRFQSGNPFANSNLLGDHYDETHLYKDWAEAVVKLIEKVGLNAFYQEAARRGWTESTHPFQHTKKYLATLLTKAIGIQ